MSTQDIDELIVKEIERHYETNDSPYYLAELGVYFREQNIEVPVGIQFKDYLRIKFDQRLTVIQDEDTPAKIAIAPLERAAHVREQLSKTPTIHLDDSRIDYGRLPFALVAAFCKVPLPGTRLYFKVAKPFRYETRVHAPDDQYIEIEDRFRPQSLAGKPVGELSSGDRREIYERITKWAEEKELDLRTLYYDTRPRNFSTSPVSDQLAGNALQRLIDAQEPELRSRLRIPGDIAGTLMRLP